MSSPYFNTYLHTTINLYPAQMDNNIYKRLKDNLNFRLLNKCYMNYGYISKIYEIKERSGGIIVPEDPSASATYNIKFSCKICYPLKNTIIIGEITNITPQMIRINNGPIDVIIAGRNNVNVNVFVYDNKRNFWLAKKDMNATSTEEASKKYMILKPGTPVRVKITDRNVIDKAEKIICMGYMEGIASEEEIRNNISAKFDDEAEFLEHIDYLKRELNTDMDENEDKTEVEKK